MEWVFLIIGLFVLAGIAGKKNEQEDPTYKVAREINEEILASAKLELKTARAHSEAANKRLEESYSNLDVNKQVKINGEPAKSFSEDCDGCGKSFMVFYAGKETPKELGQIYCPFCGKTHDFEEAEVK